MKKEVVTNLPEDLLKLGIFSKKETEHIKDMAFQAVQECCRLLY